VEEEEWSEELIEELIEELFEDGNTGKEEE
jgi:hypothetical protein